MMAPNGRVFHRQRAYQTNPLLQLQKIIMEIFGLELLEKEFGFTMGMFFHPKSGMFIQIPGFMIYLKTKTELFGLVVGVASIFTKIHGIKSTQRI